jgi:hypothetical protein
MNPAHAVSLQTSDFIDNSQRSNFNGFEGITVTDGFGSTYTEDGITVEQVNGELNDIWPTYTWWGAEGNKAWYPSGGDSGYTKITKQDSSDFVNMGLLIGSGYGANDPMTYVYDVLNNGVSVLSGTLFRNTPQNYLGFSGGGFDEVRIGAYYGNNPNQTLNGYQALAIDSIETSRVPEPATILGTLAFSTLGGSWLKRKRKKAA